MKKQWCLLILALSVFSVLTHGEPSISPVASQDDRFEHVLSHINKYYMKNYITGRLSYRSHDDFRLDMEANPILHDFREALRRELCSNNENGPAWQVYNVILQDFKKCLSDELSYKMAWGSRLKGMKFASNCVTLGSFLLLLRNMLSGIHVTESKTDVQVNWTASFFHFNMQGWSEETHTHQKSYKVPSLSWRKSSNMSRSARFLGIALASYILRYLISRDIESNIEILKKRVALWSQMLSGDNFDNAVTEKENKS